MPLQLTDTGTRYLHLTETLALWESTLDLLNDHRFESSKTKAKKLELTTAIFVMRKHIDVLGDIDDYKIQLRRKIENAHEQGSSTEPSTQLEGSEKDS